MKTKLLSLLFGIALCVGFSSAATLESVGVLPMPTRLVPELNQTGTAHSITLNWTQGVVQAGATCTNGANPSTITLNTIYRATTSGAETKLAATTAPVVTYLDSTASVAGTTYYYEVSASNCNGEGKISVEVSGTIPNPLVPGTPTGLTLVTQ